jgi:hypothetical protein
MSQESHDDLSVVTHATDEIARNGLPRLLPTQAAIEQMSRE